MYFKHIKAFSVLSRLKYLLTLCQWRYKRISQREGVQVKNFAFLLAGSEDLNFSPYTVYKIKIKINLETSKEGVQNEKN